MEELPHRISNGQMLNRPSCSFGVRCYRQNPQHRLENAHPGDVDFIFPTLPNSADDAPDCQYGKDCYRLNPKHFQELKHPPETNVELNYENYLKLKNKRRTRARARPNVNASIDEDDDNYSEDDPFQTDSNESDYMPSDDEL